MKGFSGFGNSPAKIDVEAIQKDLRDKQVEELRAKPKKEAEPGREAEEEIIIK
mgnify:CR=1 FL=1